MRFFIALEVPEENLAQFQPIQDKLYTLIPHLRITNLDKIHLTLAFIGEQDDLLKEALVQIIKKATENISAFEVTPAYIDGFPTIHNPNVLWIGVKGDIDKILLIRERIKDGLEALKLPVDERRFIPHITIAKSSNDLRVSKELEAKLQEIMTIPFNPIKISSIKLFESVANEGFHQHNVLAEIKLG
jgi:2'-5' RNA ligase